MGKTTIKASVPRGSIEKMLEMSEQLIKKHEELGAQSPLDDAEVQKFKLRTASARTEHEGAKKLHAEAEGKMQNAYTFMGLAKGQNSRTNDTNYFDLTSFRNLLLHKFKNDEEQLEQFGIKVVIKVVMTGRKGKKKE